MLPSRCLWSAWVLLGAALLGGGCLPRPQFKVKASGIGENVDTLLARVWVGTPIQSANSGAGVVIPEANLIELTPSEVPNRMTIPRCLATDTTCIPSNRTYSFGIEFPVESPLLHPLALVGLAAVDTTPAPPLPAGTDCLFGVAAGLTTLSDTISGTEPPTLEVSFRQGALQTCTSLGTAPIISDAFIAHTGRVDMTSQDVVTINGWGFRPDLSVSLSNGCDPDPIPINYDPIALPGKSQILSVTPSRIVILIDPSAHLLNPTCQPKKDSRTAMVKLNNPSVNSPLFVLY